MTTINAYLTFNGNCREAMNFYKDCMGGELTIMPVAGSPVEAECPGAMKDSILHSTLIKDSLMLMGSDMLGSGGLVQGNSVALSLNCSSEEEIDPFYASLSEGGTIIDPLKIQFWGAKFAVFNDKFGVRWMLNYDKK